MTSLFGVFGRPKRRAYKAKRRGGAKGTSAYHRCISSKMKGVRGSTGRRQSAFASAVRACKRRSR
jgi:hypothetical protein